MQRLFLNEAGELRSGWKALLFAILLGIVNIGAYGLLVGLLGLRAFTRSAAGDLIPVVLVLGVSHGLLRLEGKGWRNLGLQLGRRWGRDLLLGFAGGLLLIGLTALLLRMTGSFVWTSGAFVPAVLAKGVWTFFCVALLEELVFRGYPFQRLVEGLGPWGAQALGAGLFAIAHWNNSGIHGAGFGLKWVATLNIALAAVLLGLAYLKTGSLALPIGLHWGWNLMQGNILGFAVSGTGQPQAPLRPILQGGPDWLSGGAVGLEGSLACTVVCLGALLWLASGRESLAR